MRILYGITGVDFYFDSAVAFWLEDMDAKPDKLWEYYESVVKC